MLNGDRNNKNGMAVFFGKVNKIFEKILAIIPFA